MTDLDPAITPDFPPKSAFRAWLRSLPADEVVATDWTCHDCPLAMWLYKTNVADEPYINPGANALWGVEGAGDSPLPDWANAFGVAIDNEDERRGPVTAADCLRVLAKAPRA